jgi:DNA-binding NarL/FixJ family response regulator
MGIDYHLTMQNALIVEDLPESRAWLTGVVQAAFPALQITTAARRDTAMVCISEQRFDLALIDLGLPDGSGIDVVSALHHHQPNALSVVVTIYDDDDHIFPALQAGAFGYLLKEQEQGVLAGQLLRISQGEPPLSPQIARRVLAHFVGTALRAPAQPVLAVDGVKLTERETEVLQRVAKGYTLPEIALQFSLSKHTVGDYIKQVYRKLNISSRAEAALEAARRGLVQP